MRRIPLFTRRNLLSIGLYPKIVLIFMAAIIPILFVGSMLVVNGEKAIRREVENSLSSRVHFYVAELSTALEHIVNLKREYIFDQDIQRFSTMSPVMSDYERRVEVLALQKKMQTLKSSSAYIENVALFMVSEQKIIYPNRISYSINKEETDIHQLLNHKATPIIVWNNQLIQAERFPTGTYEDSLPAYWIEITINEQKIKSMLSQMLTENGGNAILSDLEGNWMLSGDDSNDHFQRQMTEMHQMHSEPSGQNVTRVDERDYIAAFERSPELGIALTLYMPEEVVLQPLAGYQWWFRILIATAVVIILLFAYWIYLFLQRPLQRLVRAFRKVSEGAFDVQLKSRGRDEIDYFYEQFNRMMGTIQSLIHDVYEQGIRSQRAELKHLQAQINPHFLYNTYYRLHRMAQNEDTDNIKLYTRLLGDYLKYITRNGQEEATLRIEVDHARTYADILKMRFRDKLTIEWGELPPEWENTLVPRLIVQPIVENAFIHGLEELDGQGILRFTVNSDKQSLSLIIEDNGNLLTDDRLEEIANEWQSPSEHMETTGMLNVHRRLGLKYGASSGLRISRSELGGMRVDIILRSGEEA
ncbi:sensor histidine kinase [Cohnella sp. WQ 127256]|uniref:sensor histidine kinase n=1 Tax=Cohnella sp. WQ 127256 TaxID=2938790 RepID=UPI002117DD6E|nr:histidine kinase [Cohnella sp. WQ 127256]